MPSAESRSIVLRGAKRWRLSEAPLLRAASAALDAGAPDAQGEVTLVFIGDRAMRRLNARYRGKDRPTDVLSFDVGDGRSRDEPFGDVVVSVETARRQARAYQATAVEELQRLIVHGVLHLCGFDHQERREAARMHGLTRRILRTLREDVVCRPLGRQKRDAELTLGIPHGRRKAKARH